MCGIAGMVALGDGPPADPALVRRMCDAQRHRGPDDAGLWSTDDGRIALGHRRLSIIDLSPSGHQPMQTADGALHVVFNGEIYNFPELRAELEQKGHRFQSSSDTEVILLGYREWGLGVLDRLGGMFAFALHDATRGETLLARDPLGIKPLYWARDGGRLVFSSEIQALRLAADDGGVDPASLAAYLMWGSIPAPGTLYARVRALPAGSWLRVAGGGIEGPTAYWALEDEIGRSEPMDASEAAEHARRVLLDSVRRHRIADVEVGAFLSGGVDSTALVGLMAEIAGTSITSVNLSFDSERLDEGPLAEQASALYGSRHHRIDIRVDEMRERMGDAVAALDQPSIDGVNVYFVSQAAVRAGLKVAVSGVGGDELFAGYDTFSQMRRVLGIQRAIGRIPGAGALRAPLARLLPALRPGHATRKYGMALAHGHSWSGAYYAQRGLFSVDQVRELLAPEAREALEPLCPESALDARIRWRDVPEDERVSLFEIEQYLQMQLLRDADAMSMRHSLEVRTPLVDRELVRELFRIPPRHRHAGPAKRLLREAVRPALPPVFWQRRKQGFTLPIHDWLASRSLPLSLPEHPLLDGEALGRVEADFHAGRCLFTRLWALMVLGPFLGPPRA